MSAGHFIYTVLLRVILLCTAANTLFSCASVYRPTTVSVPQLEQQNDASFTGTFGSGGVDFDAAYAPLNRFGVFVNYNMEVPGAERERNGREIKVRSRSIQGGVGHWNHVTERVFWEAYGGYGYGEAENEYGGMQLNKFIDEDTEILMMEGRFHKFFVQPGITKVYDNNVRLSFHTRIVHGYYSDHGAVVIRKNSGKSAPHERSDEVFPDRSFTTIDPVITLHMGSDPAYFFMQSGVSLRMNWMYGSYNPVILSLGMKIRL